ncbi:ankyrin repeat protein [Moumouvirus australiensis]|uniref:Ankyrin repeat protein n=1 Tax=Moumouvirus australiensis TaxID=2109587 RepID=A0A2P1EMG0_9VIRU|nr:ankyrin repeat protein [Moumouvirus australiensis]AVL95087.1 ankyrin repeat protein [Moumouvirus australiensis]
MLLSDNNDAKTEIIEPSNNLSVPDYEKFPFMGYQESNIFKIKNAIIKDNIPLFEEIISILDVKEMYELFQSFRINIKDGYPCEKFIDILFKKINFGEINLELEFFGVKMEQIIITGSAQLSNLKYIKQLIDMGFDITTPYKPNEALIIGCISGNIEMVKFLIEYGLDPNYNNTESFREACDVNQIKICEYLLKYGINIDFNSREFLYLIISTIKKNNYEMLQLLIDNGANLSFINNFVESESKNCRFNELFDLLVSQGVKEKNAHMLIHNIPAPKKFI